MNMNRTMNPQRVAVEQGLGISYYALTRVWIWVMLLIAAIQVGVAWFAIGFDHSVWFFAHQVSTTMLGVFGIMMTPTAITMYVANGMTRRNFAIGGSVFIISLSLAVALLQTVGFGIEELSYGAAGIKDGLDRPLVLDSFLDALRVFAVCLGTYIAYMSSGLLIGTAFKAWGPIVGTLLIPFAAIPLILNDFILAKDWGWSVAIDSSLRESLNVGFALTLVLAVAAAGLWVNYRMTRRVAIT